MNNNLKVFFDQLFDKVEADLSLDDLFLREIILNGLISICEKYSIPFPACDIERLNRSDLKTLMIFVEELKNDIEEAKRKIEVRISIIEDLINRIEGSDDLDHKDLMKSLRTTPYTVHSDGSFLRKSPDREEVLDGLSLIRKKEIPVYDSIKLKLFLYDFLMRVSLKIYSETFQEELENQNETAHFIHFYPPDESPRMSEFLYSYDSNDKSNQYHSFDSTKHGLGSGVYGRIMTSDCERNSLIAEKAKFKIVEVTKPLYLSSQESCDLYTELSKFMQRLSDEAAGRNIGVESGYSRKDAMEVIIDKYEKELNKYVRQMLDHEEFKLYSKIDIHGRLCESLYDFIEAANSSICPQVPMPINFFVKKLGYNGVLSSYNDSFHMGLIAFEVDSDEYEERPVKLTRVVLPPKEAQPVEDPIISSYSFPRIPSSISGIPFFISHSEEDEDVEIIQANEDDSSSPSCTHRPY